MNEFKQICQRDIARQEEEALHRMIEEYFVPALFEAGYKTVSIGEDPDGHWPRSSYRTMVFASPPTRVKGRGVWSNDVALWYLIGEFRLDSSCGNGLKTADQYQSFDFENFPPRTWRK